MPHGNHPSGQRVEWLEFPQAHDFIAAQRYLSLVHEPLVVRATVDALRTLTVEVQAAKDLLRSTWLPLLPQTNVHVQKDLSRIQRGEKLSPVLIIRGDIERGVWPQVADGYHRVCAAHWTDEDTDVPCLVGNWTKPLPKTIKRG
jgi:hypothetical protein